MNKVKSWLLQRPTWGNIFAVDKQLIQMCFAEISRVASLSSFFQFLHLLFPQIVQFLWDVVKNMEGLAIFEVFSCLFHNKFSVGVSEEKPRDDGARLLRVWLS